MPKISRRGLKVGPYTYYVLLGGGRFARWHVLVSLTEGVIKTKCGRIFLHIDEFTRDRPDGQICARCASE